MHLIPRIVRLAALVALVNIALMGLLRLIFFWLFDAPNDPVDGASALTAFYIGMKFDLRLILLALTPLMLLGWWRLFDPFRSGFGRGLWTLWFYLVGGALALFYAFDFGYYAYLHIRLDYTILRFLDNLATSADMVWESYPVVWITLGLVLATFTYGRLHQALITVVAKGEERSYRKLARSGVITLSLFTLLFGIYGKLSWYPLRWSDAFFGTHAFASAVASNPVLYFYDTFKNGGVAWNQKAVEAAYPRMAKYIGIEPPADGTIRFARQGLPLGTGFTTPPNVVLVYLESFAWYKSGLSGNPLDPTPNIDRLAAEGLLFDHYYVPHTGTARSVFAGITAIPDVQLDDTSSRNPTIIDQHTLINAFQGYEKFYFLGGSANWRNIRGLLSHNIPGLHIYEEGSYASPRIDVWGISDLDLFKEATAVLNTQQKPFVAIIQTSGNHRPYTIPEDNHGFKRVEQTELAVTDYGFESLEEFNSYRFMDHSVGYFIEQARKQPWFDNTLFVFFGDHGINHDAGRHSPKADTQLMLGSYHVPLLYYSPAHIAPARNHTVASQVDMLATTASLTGTPYTNTTFGRDLLDPRFADQRYAFTISHRAVPELGLIGPRYVYRILGDGTQARLYDAQSDNPRADLSTEYPELAAQMRTLTLDLYESARYLLNHNKPLAHTGASAQ